MRTIAQITGFISLIFLIGACGGVTKPGGGFNVFSVQDDMRLGKQTQQQIQSSPDPFPILPEKGNEEVYSYLRDIRDNILASGKVAYDEKFAWELKVIDDDKTLNAFCVPGGYIYFYTGLIRFLDSEDEVAGVMGHEIAHAAQRHSTRQLQKSYGVAILLSIATGNANPGTIEQLGAAIVNLHFSRSDEAEADAYSVIYMCESGYNAAGAAGFFKKIQGRDSPPEFLSTHPNPGNRVESITQRARESRCRHLQDQKVDRHRRVVQSLGGPLQE